jgi:hypothetical protein
MHLCQSVLLVFYCYSAIPDYLYPCYPLSDHSKILSFHLFYAPLLFHGAGDLYMTNNMLQSKTNSKSKHLPPNNRDILNDDNVLEEYYKKYPTQREVNAKRHPDRTESNATSVRKCWVMTCLVSVCGAIHITTYNYFMCISIFLYYFCQL